MKRLSVLLSLLIVVMAVVAAQDKPAGGPTPADLYGTWSGTWEGAGGNGGFVLTLERPKEKESGAHVSVTGEPAYEASVRTIGFDGNKMTAVYDFPPEPSLEVALTATFEGDTAKGMWSARGKADGSEIATGTWTVKKK